MRGWHDEGVVLLLSPTVFYVDGVHSFLVSGGVHQEIVQELPFDAMSFEASKDFIDASSDEPEFSKSCCGEGSSLKGVVYFGRHFSRREKSGEFEGGGEDQVVVSGGGHDAESLVIFQTKASNRTMGLVPSFLDKAPFLYRSILRKCRQFV